MIWPVTENKFVFRKFRIVTILYKNILKIRNKSTPYRSLSSGTTSTTSNISLNSETIKIQPKKILFFGTDNFSVATLKELHSWVILHNTKQENHNQSDIKQSNNLCLEVCTSQMKHLIQPVKVYAEQESIPVHSWPPDPSNVIKQLDFDLGVVASFGHLIPKNIIDSFPLGMLNVHGSLLPRWRGASPIHHAILAGDKVTGISIMEIKPHHFDVGNILATESVNIGCDQTFTEVTNKLAKLGGKLMVKVIKDLESYRSKSVVQEESKVTYAPCINNSFYNIDWASSTSRDVYNQYRALSESGKLYSVWKDTDVKVMLVNCIRPEIVDRLDITLENDNSPTPGRVRFVKIQSQKLEPNLKSSNKMERFICIKCKSGWIAFTHLYYGPNKLMSALDYYNGYISKNRTRPQYFVYKDAYRE